MIVIARVKAKAGMEADFEAGFAKMISKVNDEPGTLAYRLVQSTEDPTEYAVIEEYDNQSSLEYHLNTDYFKEIGESLGAVTMGPPKIDTFIEKAAIQPKSK